MSVPKAAIAVSVCILLSAGCAMSPLRAPAEDPHAVEMIEDQAAVPDTPPEAPPAPFPADEPPVQAPAPIPAPDIPPEKEVPAAPPPADHATEAPQEPADETMTAGPVAGPPPVPPVADTGMEIISSATFEGPDAATRCTTDSGDGLGLKWSLVDGAGCFSGTTRAPAPGTMTSNTVQFPVGIDVREKLEISGEFRIAHSDGYHVIALWAPADMMVSRLCIFYSGRPGRGNYFIQPSWMKMETALDGKRTLPAFGDEKDTFHKMRMLLDRSKKQVQYFVDDIFMGTVTYKGEVAPITSVGMDIEGSRGGTALDIRYDNIQVRSFGPLY